MPNTTDKYQHIHFDTTSKRITAPKSWLVRYGLPSKRRGVYGWIIWPSWVTRSPKPATVRLVGIHDITAKLSRLFWRWRDRGSFIDGIRQLRNMRHENSCSVVAVIRNEDGATVTTLLADTYQNGQGAETMKHDLFHELKPRTVSLGRIQTGQPFVLILDRRRPVDTITCCTKHGNTVVHWQPARRSWFSRQMQPELLSGIKSARVSWHQDQLSDEQAHGVINELLNQPSCTPSLITELTKLKQ